MSNFDPVGIEAMKEKIGTYLGLIDIDNIDRKYHDRTIYELVCMFRSVRSIAAKKVLIR